MIRILTEPPDAIPAEVTAAMEASAQTQLRLGAGMGARVMLVWFLFLPLFWWMGMRDVGVIASVLGPIGVAVPRWASSRRAGRWCAPGSST